MKNLKEVGKQFQKLILHQQQEKCRKIIQKIFDQLDQEENEDVFLNVDGSFNKLIEITESLFSDPDQGTLLHLYIRRIFLGIASERGYYEKLIYREEGGKIADNIVNCYYWFKLYSTVVIDSPKKIRYEFLLENMSEFRGGLEHGLQTSSQKEDITIIGSLVFLWNLLEDVFERWYQVTNLSEEELKNKIEKLGNCIVVGERSEEMYGFVNRLENDIGYITSYLGGESDKGTRFQLENVNFFPCVGDIVIFADHQEQYGRGREYPTKTADYVKKV